MKLTDKQKEKLMWIVFIVGCVLAFIEGVLSAI